MKVSKRFRFNYLVFVVLALNSGFVAQTVCSAQSRAERDVRERVTEFYQNFSDGHYDSMWNMSSMNFRNRNNNDRKAYTDSLREFQGFEFRLEIESVSIVRRKAVTTIRKCILLPAEKNWKCEVTDEKWIFERKKWFFDL